MKKTFLTALLLLAVTAQGAPLMNVDPNEVSNVLVRNEPLGSGVPGVVGWEQAVQAHNNVFHVPQYLPYHPTAATIWPRVIEVPCTKHHGALLCDGYHWTPAMGRAEYLFVSPRLVEPVAPVIVEKIVTVPGPERIILREVPVKPKRE